MGDELGVSGAAAEATDVVAVRGALKRMNSVSLNVDSLIEQLLSVKGEGCTCGERSVCVVAAGSLCLTSHCWYTKKGK